MRFQVVDGVKAGVVDACAALEKKCFAKHEAMDIAQEVKKRGVTLLAATQEGSPLGKGGVCLGYLVLQRTSIAAAVTKLLVAPAARRQGVGGRLLEAALEQARAARAQLATLHVDAANASAQRLYKRVGFVLVSVRKDYYKVGRDAHAMELAFEEQ